MLSSLSLRIRIFLFFALLMAGALAALTMGLWLAMTGWEAPRRWMPLYRAASSRVLSSLA